LVTRKRAFIRKVKKEKRGERRFPVLKSYGEKSLSGEKEVVREKKILTSGRSRHVRLGGRKKKRHRLSVGAGGKSLRKGGSGNLLRGATGSQKKEKMGNAHAKGDQIPG